LHVIDHRVGHALLAQVRQRACRQSVDGAAALHALDDLLRRLACPGRCDDLRERRWRRQRFAEGGATGERENRRTQDEYDDQVKAAQKRVRELNNRFADWYYVVSNKEYAKIHLTRDAIAQKKEAEPKEPQPPK
jgi:hypothetical protein